MASLRELRSSVLRTAGISEQTFFDFQKQVPGGQAFVGGNRGGEITTQRRVSPLLQLFAAKFGGGGGGGSSQSQPDPDPVAPGDPGNIQAANERQQASADALNVGASDPIVAGRRDALLARRSKGVGLAPLGRGFTARNLLSTSSI